MTDTRSTPGSVSPRPYKVDTEPMPLDLYSEYGTGGRGCWYRVPSWRVHFDYDALRGVDVRMHRGIASSAVWTLSEATTGFKMFNDLAHDHYFGDEDSMLLEFSAGVMLKLTPEYVEKAIAKAKEILKEKIPSPFAQSESEHVINPAYPSFKAMERDARDAARYRWLRSEVVATDPRYYDFWNEFNSKLCREEKMDAAVDAAMESCK